MENQIFISLLGCCRSASCFSVMHDMADSFAIVDPKTTIDE